MNFFIDTEFIESFHKPFLGKKRHFIDLISIGIVREDGECLYLISSEYNYNDADPWVRENVILPLYLSTVHGDQRNHIHVENFHKRIGFTNVEIAKKIALFSALYDPTFYAYYADYDWVLFCSLFGTMMKLPKTFPMYCRDLKQMLDESLMAEFPINGQLVNLLHSTLDSKYVIEIRALKTLKEKLDWVKKYCRDYPKQENEHSALDDARWNLKLFNFIKTL